MEKIFFNAIYDDDADLDLTKDEREELTNQRGKEPEGVYVPIERASFTKDSSLVSYTRWSPNYSSRGNRKISKITIHHMAGALSVERCGEIFANRNTGASTNYGVGVDGRIGQYVPEKYRAWSTTNYDNDSVAVNIELANSSTGGTWPVSDKVINACIKLVADICKRNGIKKLNYTGNKNGNLTMHQWFCATACPGPYLKTKFNYIAQEVNKILEGKTSTTTKPSQTTSKAFKVKVSVSDLWIRAGAGTNTAKKGFCPKGVYTITETKKNGGYTWGKLKSGQGWIALDFTTRL